MVQLVCPLRTPNWKEDSQTGCSVGNLRGGVYSASYIRAKIDDRDLNVVYTVLCRPVPKNHGDKDSGDKGKYKVPDAIVVFWGGVPPSPPLALNVYVFVSPSTIATLIAPASPPGEPSWPLKIAAHDPLELWPLSFSTPLRYW
jgi:hypothetical protein